ncbi:MAG TPA: phosphotransferase [Spirochaetota bacterium]|nr:phosphotransferase [Spirochaetota bacterium]HPI91283.1 phosphotransferase [Spirochaetota bacterium]HPR49840.1 phosphotransferase [Spirochaetota bacterium]
MTPEELIRSFAAKHLGKFKTISLLAGDASHRVYYRILAESQSFIVCCDRNFTSTDDYPFLDVHRILSGAGVPLPAVYEIDAPAGLLLMEDLGDDLLEYALCRFTTEQKEEIYREIIDILLRLQSLKGSGGPFSLRFDMTKLMFEFDFFIDHFIRGYLQSPLDDAGCEELRAEFRKICEVLDRADMAVLNHRDFHSRNIILKNGNPYIIDFQDARMGLPHYDLASLLRDSYVLLDEDLYCRLRTYYHEAAARRGFPGMDRDDFYFDCQAFQRNVKALGTFGYQCSVAGNRKFEQYIVPTAQYLPDYCSRHAVLRKAGDIIRMLIDTSNKG